jgi:hypothetical protein
LKIKSIAIEITTNAFLPEAYAYRDYFIEKGFECDFVNKGDPSLLNYDCALLFHGFHPFWKKYPKFIIGEYHSLSTGRYNRVKDLVKRLLNVRSNIYIFLNDDVRRKMWFSNKINYTTRSMGYSEKDFESFKGEEKKFDVVYCGSYRKGLWEIIKKLADLGLSIAVVGPEIPFEHELITSFGRKEPVEARKIISQAKYGLNYTPDVFPLNIQDSTKVIEYCAAGLGVITNHYEWVKDFEMSRSASFLYLDLISKAGDVKSFNFINPDVSDLSWDDLMFRSGIFDKINEI